jgi:ketosteroid isomerase-like protein
MRAAQLTGGTMRLELEDVLANDSRAVALFRGRATREGRTLDNPTCLRMRIENGQIVEVWEFVWDLFAVDAFWT